MNWITNKKVCLSLAATALVSGCAVSFRPVEPVVTVTPPVVEVGAPVVTVGVPEAYVWDGVEFVGEVNGGFVCLNPAGVWVGCDPVVIERFHGWERGHPDWRRSAIHNDKYRRAEHHEEREKAKATEKRAPEKKEEEKR
jgi:hypothetical protein